MSSSLSPSASLSFFDLIQAQSNQQPTPPQSLTSHNEHIQDNHAVSSYNANSRPTARADVLVGAMF